MKDEFLLSGLKPDELMARGMLTEAGSGDLNSWVPPEVEQLERIIAGYKVENMIAKGGMGAVYKVTQKDLNRVCALKLLPLEVSEEPGFEDRFILEARAMASLNHPNIMTIYDFGRTKEGHVFYVMEFVDGLDLSELIKVERLEEAKAIEILMQVCDALEYAHDSGFVHRDVKPANVMIDQLGRVKVTDFGLAKLLNADTNHAMTMVGQVMGTPDYMAPEQSTGINVDHRADIYALGVVLYELLTGTLPKGIFAPPSVKAEVDVKYDDVVIKAMQQQPEFRFQKISEVKSSLQEAHQSSISKSKSKFKPKSKQKPKWNPSDTKAWTVNATHEKAKSHSGGAIKALMGVAALALVAGGYWVTQHFNKDNESANVAEVNVSVPTQGEDKDLTVKIGSVTGVDDQMDSDKKTEIEENLSGVDAEINSLVLDIKSSRDELMRKQQIADEERLQSEQDEKIQLAEAIELEKRNAEKREQEFLMAQNSELGMQLSARGQDLPDDFFDKVNQELLEADAEGGNADAQFLLGRMYQLGKGVSVSEETAEKWYKMASAQGHQEAQQQYKEKFFEEGLKYYHGDGVKQDYAKALENFQKAAEREHRISMNLLGWMYDEGEGVERNPMQAASWYRKSADLGYASAQYNLGECYQNGLGVDQDLSESMRWYRKSAEQGNQPASIRLSDFYREGLKSGKDPKETAKWITEGAESGDAAAQCELGKLYIAGKGVQRDPKIAVSWLRKSAEQGYDRGQHNLGMCYLNGLGVVISNEKAVEWFQKAVAQGNAKAHRELGNMYANGAGVKKNYKKAAALYKIAAEAGIVEAQYNMGICYKGGLGVTKSAKLAVKWFTKSAEQGYAIAQYNLGVCYYNGVGVKKSSSKAKRWFKKAADAGNDDAKKVLKELR